MKITMRSDKTEVKALVIDKDGVLPEKPFREDVLQTVFRIMLGMGYTFNTWDASALACACDKVIHMGPEKFNKDT
jgi:hypothetical protein